MVLSFRIDSKVCFLAAVRSRVSMRNHLLMNHCGLPDWKSLTAVWQTCINKAAPPWPTLTQLIDSVETMSCHYYRGIPTTKKLVNNAFLPFFLCCRLLPKQDGAADANLGYSFWGGKSSPRSWGRHEGNHTSLPFLLLGPLQSKVLQGHTWDASKDM